MSRLNHAIRIEHLREAMMQEIPIASYSKAGSGVIRINYSPFGQEYFVYHKVCGDEIKHVYKNPQSAIDAYNAIRL